MNFNLHALIGGQMEHDREHKLYLLYPQGNWVEVGAGTPYCIIGETGYESVEPFFGDAFRGILVLFLLALGIEAFETRVFPELRGTFERMQHRPGAQKIHVVLQHLLDLPTPIYHHHRLIRDDQGKRLAKRDDARALSKYRAEGATDRKSVV